MTASKYYMYALVKNEAQAAFEHVKPVSNPEAALRWISVGKVAAIVSDVDQDEIMSTRRNMLTHTKALEEIMQDRAILPFSFGTIVDDVAAIEQLIASQEQRLVADLNGLEGFVEVGVRATWDETVIFREIVETNGDLRRLADQIKTRPATETYYDRIELGRQVEAIVKTKREAESKNLAALLGAIATKSKIHESSADMVVLDAAFLVEVAREKELFAVLEDAERKNPDRFAFKYLSPVPPYNFVALKFPGKQARAA
ncbi:MAG: GvpL/GvpF family gas vesicle protein [Rhizobiaceae bacterium]